MMRSLEAIEQEASQILAETPEGQDLTPLSASLIALAVRASVVSLDPSEISASIAQARQAGASTDQIHEIVSLVSGLGVHTLMVSATLLIGEDEKAGPLDEERQKLWQRYVGDAPYWKAFDNELPGFLDSLLRVSPASFRAFFDYCAVPWTTKHVDAMTKELAAMACDANPGHRFGPGFRLHCRNAIKLGAGKKAIFESLRIASAAPQHTGIA